MPETTPPSLLLVDSYDSSRGALAEYLRESGFAVTEAHNGVEGLRRARESRPDLIVVDLWPFFSASVQMLERLRGVRETYRVPVLVLTSSVPDEYRERALAAGCAGYLEKPCPPEEVLRVVERILVSMAPAVESPVTGSDPQAPGT